MTAARPGPDGRPARMLIVENDTVPDLESAIARYLRETAAQPRAAVRNRRPQVVSFDPAKTAVLYTRRIAQ